MSEKSVTTFERPYWPPDIPKPKLPDGYEWVMLGEALGLKNKDGTHPWFIRLKWTTHRGYSRMLKCNKEYFDTPKEAIQHALSIAQGHWFMRSSA